jgi:Bacterial Ig-like domain (group 2)
VRAVVLLFAATFLTAGCSKAPSAPSTSAPAPTPTPAAPALATVGLCCGSNVVQINVPRQIEARATYYDGSSKDVTSAVTSWRVSNPSIATISGTGVVTASAPGDFIVTGTYAGHEPSWDLHVYLDPGRPPAATEVSGIVSEITRLGPRELAQADVEVVGGAADGRVVRTSFGGVFRIDGLSAPGFDLVVRRRGYETARVRVAELGRELGIELKAGEGHIADLLEGGICSRGETITRTFTPRAAGILRISARAQADSGQLYADGALLYRSLQTGQDDVELRAGVKYELRVTGRCEYGPPTIQLAFLRPVD